MMTIYTTEDILTEMFEDEVNENKYAVWLDFMLHTDTTVKFKLRENSDFTTNENNIVALNAKEGYRLREIDTVEKSLILTIFMNALKDECYKNINIDDKYIESIGDILDSNSMLLLDIDLKTSKRISERYGLICTSFRDSKGQCPLFYTSREAFCEQSKKKLTDDQIEEKWMRSWNHVMDKKFLRPANSLVFIDRYLFAGNMYDGIYNICYFLQRILPPKLAVSFHILVIFDSRKIEHFQLKEEKDDISKFQRLNYVLNKCIRNMIQRPYPIVIELASQVPYKVKDEMAISVSPEHYYKTHNRRVLANYYIIRAEKSLKIQHKKEICCDQWFSLEWYASKGKRFDSGRCLEKSIDDMKDIVQWLKDRNEIVLFSQNGKFKSISEIVNRLVR